MITLSKKKIDLAEAKKMNSVRQIREEKMMSKAELARQSGVTVQTIDRIEKGYDCRLDTKRKILFALGFKLSDRERLFVDED
jgi:DNA-binding XRE family transcriptional regulator